MTSPEQLGWGLVGLGRIAKREIAPAIGSAANSSLVGVVSRDSARAAEFARDHGARHAYDDYDALLGNADVDAVYIATPNALHVDQVLAAAKAGKHVLCDKPLALTVPDAERVISACADAGVRLGVTFQSRNYEGMADVRRLVADGSIGRVVLAQVEMSAGRTLLGGWRTDPSLAGVGSMNNIGVHGYDLLRYLLDAEVVEATALLDAEPGFELETTALALLRFANGALAYVNANQSTPHHQPDVVLYGTEGRVVGRNVSRPNLDGTFTVTTEKGETRREVSTAGGYEATVATFADAVLAGREPSPSGQDGLRSVALTDALSRSAREGRTVALSP